MAGHVLALDVGGSVEHDAGSGIPEIWQEVNVAMDVTALASAGVGTTFVELFGSGPDDDTGVGIELSGGDYDWFAFPPNPLLAPLTPIVAMQFYRIKVHVLAGSPGILEVWIDGRQFATIATGVNFTGFEWYDLLRSGISAGFVYFDDYIAGTTEGGSDIFADDFESTLAGWTTSGPAAIVVDPGIAPPGPPTPGGNVLVSQPPWRIVVADIVFNGSGPPGFSTLTFLDQRAVNRQLRYYLRQADTAAGRVLADDPEVNIVHVDGEPFLAEGLRAMIWLRREGGTPPWKPRHCGILLQANRTVQGEAPYVDFTSYGPRQLLYKRPVRNGSGLLLGPRGLVFKAQKGSDILLALLARTAAADGPHFIDVTTGTLEDTDPIDISFQQGSSVGEALDELEKTGTMDVLLPAVYDPVGSPGILAQLNIHVLAGTVKHAAIMSWDMAGRSLESIDWLEDGTQRENNVELYTANGLPTPIASNAPSVAKYGSYWGQQNYPVQTQLSALEAAAAVRLLTQKDHPSTVQLHPLPVLAPIPFNEYFLADWLPTYASARLGKKLAGSYRVYEIDLDVGDDAVETASLLVSQNLPPA